MRRDVAVVFPGIGNTFFRNFLQEKAVEATKQKEETRKNPIC
jgi:hypothetical protein